MFNRIWSALALRRRGILEAEALVLRYGASAESFGKALSNEPFADDDTRRHYRRVAAIANWRHELFNELDTATKYTKAARWRSRQGAMTQCGSFLDAIVTTDRVLAFSVKTC